MKPSDFFVGAMEFFAILMPGAWLAFLLIPVAPVIFGSVLPELASAPMQWVAFVVVAFVFGHLLHHLGSFLDDSYNHGYRGDMRKFGDEPLFTETKKLVKKELGPEFDLTNMNYFGWAGSYVRVHNATAAAELDRLEGDSKFFRSLCIVAGLAVVIFLCRHLPLAALGAGYLAAFSYQRFCKRRWDASQQTYEYYVLLQRQSEKDALEQEEGAAAVPQ